MWDIMEEDLKNVYHNSILHLHNPDSNRVDYNRHKNKGESVKCPGCKKQKKADNCIQCAITAKNTLSAALDDLELIAMGTTSMDAIINKINQIRKKTRGSE